MPRRVGFGFLESDSDSEKKKEKKKRGSFNVIASRYITCGCVWKEKKRKEGIRARYSDVGRKVNEWNSEKISLGAR